jgi:class 3 adenylate cyclase
MMSQVNREASVSDDDISCSSNTVARKGDEAARETVRSTSQKASPEALVERHDQALLIVKILFVVVFILVAGAATSLIFVFTRDSQKRSFESDFSFIAQSITATLADDMAYFFKASRSISTALTVIMAAYNSSQLEMTVPIPMFSSLTQEATETASGASWNPLLRNDDERRQFEDMVSAKEHEGYFSEGLYPACYVCGDETLAPSTPSTLITFPGIGTYSCRTLDEAGRSYILSEGSCVAATSAVVEQCACSVSEVDHGTTKADRKPSQGLFRFTEGENRTAIDEPWTGGPYLPMWLDSASLKTGDVMLYNLLSHPKSSAAVSNMLFSGFPQVTQMYPRDETHFYTAGMVDDHPTSYFFAPVTSPYRSEIIGAVSMPIPWEILLSKTVPKRGEFVSILIENSCGDESTYRVQNKGFEMTWLGRGDLHDVRYDHMVHRTSYEDFSNLALNSGSATKSSDNPLQGTSCEYRFSVFPTSQLEDQYITNAPWINSLSVIAAFIFTSVLFLLYDYIVRRRQVKIMKSAMQTNDIVASLIPDAFRDRLYEQMNTDKPGSITSSPGVCNSKLAMSSFLAGSTQSLAFSGDPIADFFPSCTVAFIDIANFTAWCSEREPSQVFLLLENLYHIFDQVAEQLGIFKVETIGDSYVAVCGLPTPREDHAETMARFAHLCLSKMKRLVKSLEIMLGPSTGDLVARCGMHSGPVTAGVLRGTKARFQLFGDTVNTASRMESSGAPSRIHASAQTIALLNKFSKGSWIVPREEPVQIKGKGILQTYWLDLRRQTDRSLSIGSANSVDDHLVWRSNKESKDALQRKQRLIEWNVEVLHELLTSVATTRAALQTSGTDITPADRTSQSPNLEKRLVIDEMTEVIALPKFNGAVHRQTKQVALPEVVKDQLRAYVSVIAHSYREVPFHNFEHASHVIMSATKLMKRIMSPEGIDYDTEGIVDESIRKVANAQKIHQVTYGMSSDPLMQFSVVFSSLIHDVDHTGLTNKELVDMKASVAEAYRGKCVAEQNSVDLAWALLKRQEYSELRACIFSNLVEERRFRELVVDAVLATDIADKELGTLRKNRWDQAFAENPFEESTDFDVDRKATIVFEHIIQASDVCHTMQHWHTYQKFNTRLFEERYIAYRKGVAGENPPWESRYKGEIWFFDNYVIPLAKKLNDCGVFGVSYHEYLSYAQENRAEWERKGREIVENLRMEIELKYQNFEFENSEVVAHNSRRD